LEHLLRHPRGYGRGIKPTSFSFSPSAPPPSRTLKIPPFSEDDPTPKAEISYSEWHHDVQCLKKDPSLLDSQVRQAVRFSLRGTAWRLVVSLGESVFIDDILHKLSVYNAERSR
jgi:hypothetical protein